MLKKFLITFLCVTNLSVFYASESSHIDDLGVRPIKTTFHIFSRNAVLAIQSDMENKEISTSGRIYGAGGAIVGGIGGGTAGAGAVFLGSKLLGVTATNTSIAIGAGVGGVTGLGIGAWLGSEYGKSVGEARPRELVKENLEWIPSSYLDLAFHTTQGDDTLYYLTVKLRPTDGGWFNQREHEGRTYLAKEEIKWLIGNARNDTGDEYFMRMCARYESVFMQDGQAHRLKSRVEELNQYICASDDHVDLPLAVIRAEELFRGTLSNAVSIFDIANFIKGIKGEREALTCSCSGKAKINSRSVVEDVINPAVFTCRLLSALGVNIEESSLGEVLDFNRKGVPITRNAVISSLYRDRESLGLMPNRTHLEKYFPDTIPS